MLWFDDKKQWSVFRTSTPLPYAVTYCLLVQLANCTIRNSTKVRPQYLIFVLVSGCTNYGL